MEVMRIRLVALCYLPPLRPLGLYVCGEPGTLTPGTRTQADRDIRVATVYLPSYTTITDQLTRRE